MGCPCELRSSCAESLLRTAQDEVLRLEAKYSRYRDDSLTTRINHAAGAEALSVDEETAGLLDLAHQAWLNSGGRFDLSSGVLRRAWNFKSGVLPHPAAIERALQNVGWEKIEWRRPKLRLRTGMELDFGGLVKEYAADRAAAILRSGGSGGLVDLGGDLAVAGPQANGRPWRIGVRNPRQPERALAVIELSAGALATSGDYERGMTVQGQRYSHLLDPRSGWPVRGPASVSVQAPLCVLAGVASTSAMLMGDGAAQWLEDLGLPHLCVTHTGALLGTLAAARGPETAAASCSSNIMNVI